MRALTMLGKAGENASKYVSALGRERNIPGNVLADIMAS